MNLENYNKILIIRLSSLGDVLLTTPLLRTLKSKFPNLKVDFLLREQYKDAILYNPNVNEIISISKNYNLHDIKSKISKNRYDLIVDLQNNFRSKSLTKNLPCDIIRFNKPWFKKFALVKFKLNLFKKIIPIPVRYAESIPDFSLDDKGLEIITNLEQEKKLAIDKNYIGFCPGSRHKTKMWPEEYYIELGKLLTENGITVVLFGGKDDMDVCEKMSNLIPNSLNFANNNDLLKTAAEMKKCKAVICNDSGLMHLTLAAGIPVIAIFGSTVKEFGFSPYKGNSLVLENNLLSCRPCSHIGLEKCPKKHFKCMLEIKPAHVLEKTMKFIS